MLPNGACNFEPTSAERVADATRFIEANKARISSLGKTITAPRQRGEFLAIIKTEGPAAEADFSDKRHWVEAVKNDNAESDDPDVETAITERADGDIRARYVTATNLADVDDEHYAPEGAGVHVHWEIDPGGNKRYWFILGLAGAILVGGNFNASASRPTDNCAAWNGTKWTAFRSALGDMPGAVIHDVCVFQGDVYICGDNIIVNTPNPSQIVSIARWNGTDFEALGSSNTPADSGDIAIYYSMAVYDGGLVCAGDRGGSGDQIAVYDGASWSSIGGPDDYRVTDIVEYDGDLWATGYFTSVDAGAAEGLASYDGASWTVPADGLVKTGPASGEGECLAVWDDGDGEALYVGGDFDEAGGVAATNIARYRSGTWSAIGAGIPGSGRVRAICGHENDDGAFLYAGGSSVGGNPLQRFEESHWRPVGSILYQVGGFTAINSLCEYGGELIVIGAFDAEYQIQFADGGSRVVRSNLPDTEDYSERGRGLNAACFALCVFDGSLYAGGAFTIATQEDGTQVTAHRLARFDGPTLLWTDVADIGDKVRALVEYNGKLYFGGDFTTAAALSAAHLARWDGAVVTTFGGVNGPVHALYEDAGGNLVIGGEFTLHDGAPAVNANAIIKWDGLTTWTAYGDGFALAGGNAKVNAIIEYGGDLIACGRFDTANLAADVVNNIARWDGVEWVALDTGLDGEALCMAVYGGDLYVGGAFGEWVKKWDGAAWSSVSTTFYRACNALWTWDGDLYAAGSNGTYDYGELFRFDGSTWDSIAPGFRGRIMAITNGDGTDGAGDRLYLGGDFNRTGDTTVDGQGAANRVMRFTVDGLRTLGGGVGVRPNFFLGLDGGAAHRGRALTFDPGDGPVDLLFVVGRFAVCSDTTTEAIGRMGRRKWRAIQIGLRGDFGDFICQCRAMLKHDDGSGRAVYAAGAFSRAVNLDDEGGIHSVDAQCVARHRDGQWEGLPALNMDYLVTDLCEHPALFEVPATLESPNTITVDPDDLADAFAENLEGSTVTVANSSGGNDGDYVIENVVDGQTATITTNWPDSGALPDSVKITIRRPHLYAAGWFSTPDRVGKWDGEQWVSLGDLRTAIGADFTLECCISFEDAFWVGTTQGQIWRWNGTDWEDVSPGAASVVYRMFAADLHAGTKLYASIVASTFSDPCVLVWDGAAWVGVGTNSGQSVGLAMLKATGSDPARLVSFGGMDIAGISHSVTVWDGATWTALGDIGGADIANDIYASGGKRVLICGTLSDVDGVPITGVGEHKDDWALPGAGGTNGPTLRMKK